MNHDDHLPQLENPVRTLTRSARSAADTGQPVEGAVAAAAATDRADDGTSRAIAGTTALFAADGSPGAHPASPSPRECASC